MLVWHVTPALVHMTTALRGSTGCLLVWQVNTPARILTVHPRLCICHQEHAAQVAGHSDALERSLGGFEEYSLPRRASVGDGLASKAGQSLATSAVAFHPDDELLPFELHVLEVALGEVSGRPGELLNRGMHPSHPECIISVNRNSHPKSQQGDASRGESCVDACQNCWPARPY